MRRRNKENEMEIVKLISFSINSFGLKPMELKSIFNIFDGKRFWAHLNEFSRKKAAEGHG